MSRLDNLNRNLENAQTPAKVPVHSEEFRIDDPMPVMDGKTWVDYMETALIDDYYEPALPMDALAKTMKASGAHASAIHWKNNKLVSSYIPHPKLSRSEFERFSFNYWVMGNTYMEEVRSRTGGVMAYRHSPAMKTRRMKDPREFLYLKGFSDKHYFKPGSVYHFMDVDVKQEIYGEPKYMGGLQSVWLNEASVLFRRRYFENGSHAGFILYINDALHKTTGIDDLKKKLSQSKGPGNFKNLLLYAPTGKKDGIQVLPLAEAQAKDEFFNMTRATRTEILVAHRTPPQILGMTPENAGGFGDANTADQLTYLNEIVPVQERMKEMNEFFGEEVLRFRDYTPAIPNKES